MKEYRRGLYASANAAILVLLAKEGSNELPIKNLPFGPGGRLVLLFVKVRRITVRPRMIIKIAKWTVDITARTRG